MKKIEGNVMNVEGAEKIRIDSNAIRRTYILLHSTHLYKQ